VTGFKMILSSSLAMNNLNTKTFV